MTESRPPVERLADAVVYAPLGFALEARRLFPDLAHRGRRQVKFTWVVGKYAVRRGEERASQVLGDVTGTVDGVLRLMGLRSNGPEPAATADSSPIRAAAVTTNGHHTAAPEAVRVPRADSSRLAIPDYDSLSAFQVVPRLEGLGGEELEAVRDYEQATRGRRTILNRIAQLQAG